MSNTCEANDCDKPTEGYICNDTLTDLERLLAETPWLVHELENVLTKQTRFATQSGKVSTKGASQPLILNPDASDSLTELTFTMLSWQANLADSIGTPVRYPKPARAAAWMMGNLNNIARFTAAGDLYNEIHESHKHARKLIDRPSERRYLGDCNADINDFFCNEPLWGRDREKTVICKVCSTEWDQDARLVMIREKASEGLNDRIMTASEAAGVLVAYNLTEGVDEIRMTDRIRKWAAQPKDPSKSPKLVKRVDLKHIGERPRPGYKFGDILAVLNNQKRKIA